MKIRHQVFTNFKTNNSKLRGYLKWWSNQTKKHPKRMVFRSVEFFREHLLYAIFTFDGDKLVSAAGIIWCRDMQNGRGKMYYRDELVVELGSNFVDPAYEDNGIGTRNLEKRLVFCKKKTYFPVSVTSSDRIEHMFEHKRKNSQVPIAIKMEKLIAKYPDLIPIFLGVREPHEKKTPYAFPEFLPSFLEDI